MTPTQVLHTVYLCIIAAILILGGAAMVWWHHDAVLEGEAKCQKQTADAAAKQHTQDVQASQDVIDGLNQDKLRLQAQIDRLPATPPPIRPCGRVFYVDRPLPAGTSTAGAQPGEPAKRAADSGVPGGSRGGDVGTGVRDIALAAQLCAVYHARTYQFAVKTR